MRPIIKLHETEIRLRAGRFRKTTEPRWYFTLVGGNGEVQFTSELYVSESNAERGIADVRKNMKQNPAVLVVPKVVPRGR